MLGKPLLDIISNYKNGFRDGDLDKRRMLLSGLIERITIDGQSVSVSWRV